MFVRCPPTSHSTPTRIPDSPQKGKILYQNANSPNLTTSGVVASPALLLHLIGLPTDDLISTSPLLRLYMPDNHFRNVSCSC